MDDATLLQGIDYNKLDVLILPTGDLGLHFSDTVPGEIVRADEESPIYESSVQFIGRIAFHVSIPNTIDICGAFDNMTLDTILTTYSNIPNRKLIFKNSSDSSNQGIVTTTVLPTGPVNASFRSSRGLIKSRTRIYVERSPPNMNFEFPVGHFVKKVIIPNRLELDGGIRTTKMLRQTLDRFADVEGRKIVFQKKNSRRGPPTTTAAKSVKTKWVPLEQSVEH